MGEALTLARIKTDQVHLVLAKCKRHLQNALDRNQGEFLFEDIKLGLTSGFMDLWISYTSEGGIVAAAVTEMRQFAQRRICYIVLFSANEGVGLGLEGALDDIELWARGRGADAMAAYTRRGFARTLKDRSYNEVYTVIQKKLTDRRLH